MSLVSDIILHLQGLNHLLATNPMALYDAVIWFEALGVTLSFGSQGFYVSDAILTLCIDWPTTRLVVQDLNRLLDDATRRPGPKRDRTRQITLALSWVHTHAPLVHYDWKQGAYILPQEEAESSRTPFLLKYELSSIA